MFKENNTSNNITSRIYHKQEYNNKTLLITQKNYLIIKGEYMELDDDELKATKEIPQIKAIME